MGAALGPLPFLRGKSMFDITIKDNTYKVKYGINAFADTDLMDRVQWLIDSMNNRSEEINLRELVTVLRELIFVGCKKENPIESLETAGDLLDDYIEERSDDEDVVMDLFMRITKELVDQGFLGDLLKTANRKTEEKSKKQVRK